MSPDKSRVHIDPYQPDRFSGAQCSRELGVKLEMAMSKTHPVAVLVVSVWVAVSPAAPQSTGATLQFAATGTYAMVPHTAESDASSGIAEQSRTCTYQGGPKSGNWACR